MDSHKTNLHRASTFALIAALRGARCTCCSGEWDEGEVVDRVSGVNTYAECDTIRSVLGVRSGMDLTNIHTKQLLKWLSYARACGGYYSPVDSHSNHGASFDEIKDELAKREHVPNKKEAKAIRQAAAKRGK